MKRFASRDVLDGVLTRFETLYGAEARKCLDRFIMLLGRYEVGDSLISHAKAHWSEQSVYLITYGDMVTREGERPLQTLHLFLKQQLKGAIDTVHILPFFPYSSDDGFSVIDYRAVNSDLGSWKDIRKISKDFDLMFDLVLNHASRHSAWFKGFIGETSPFLHYFIEMKPGTDLSQVVRPRTSPLLTAYETRTSTRWVWTTFSDDQCDLNFANPDLLFEFLDILLFYISMGAKAVRLDAIAYLWKRLGTECIHLPETHEIVKLFRDLLDIVAPQVVLLTETNVPHKENVSYFGDGDEAHMVYQFSLPPLLLHALLTDNTKHLTSWAMSLGNAPAGCTYLNFTASHDGIGIRPLQGLISDEELASLASDIEAKGGYVSKKMNADGSQSPYELNITYFDALGKSSDTSPDLKIARFLCSQTVAMALQGVSAVYFNSLVAAPNNTGGVEFTGQARTINRGKWDAEELEQLINNPGSAASEVFSAYLNLLHIRTEHSAFHPDAPQRIIDAGSHLFCIERIALDRSEIIYCISNFTAEEAEVVIDNRFPGLSNDQSWQELIRQEIPANGDGTLRLDPYETCWLQVFPDD